MKTILVLLILCCVIALPALGELTDTDLAKIRLIVYEAEKRIIGEVKTEIKTEISASEKRMKEYVSQEIKTVNANIEANSEQLSWAFWLIIALIGFIVLPQAIVAWRIRKDRTLEKQIEVLTQEVEALKQQRIVSP